VLLLDELNKALDPRSEAWLLDILDAWKSEGPTIVIATHDLTAAAEMSDASSRSRRNTRWRPIGRRKKCWRNAICCCR